MAKLLNASCCHVRALFMLHRHFNCILCLLRGTKTLFILCPHNCRFSWVGALGISCSSSVLLAPIRLVFFAIDSTHIHIAIKINVKIARSSPLNGPRSNHYVLKMFKCINSRMQNYLTSHDEHTSWMRADPQDCPHAALHCRLIWRFSRGCSV